MDAVTTVPPPANEPIRQYPPGSADRAALEGKVKELTGERAELTMTIGGQRAVRRRAADRRRRAAQLPARARHHAQCDRAGRGRRDRRGRRCRAGLARDVLRRPGGDLAARRRPARLARGGRRSTPPRSLGQSKSVYQAEIDAACELIDFWRFNVHFARRAARGAAAVRARAPGTGWSTGRSRASSWRSRRSTSPRSRPTCRPRPPCWATWWCGSRRRRSSLPRTSTMRLLEAAGLPPGVINLVTGDGQAVSAVALPHRDLAGIHFTGSTATFQHLWRDGRREHLRLPRLPAPGRRDRRQGLRGGAPVRRPARCWPRRWSGARSSTRGRSAPRPRAPTCRARCGTACATTSLAQVESLTMGDVAADLSLFMGAVIDERAFAKHSAALERARGRAAVRGPHRAARTTPRATSSSRPCWSAPTRATRCSPPSTSGRSSPCTSTTTRRYADVLAQARRRGAVRADRLDRRQGPGGDRRGHRRAAVRGGQLLHQRQADRGGRRAAAVRRCPGQRAPTTRPARSST